MCVNRVVKAILLILNWLNYRNIFLGHLLSRVLVKQLSQGVLIFFAVLEAPTLYNFDSLLISQILRTLRVLLRLRLNLTYTLASLWQHVVYLLPFVLANIGSQQKTLDHLKQHFSSVQFLRSLLFGRKLHKEVKAIVEVKHREATRDQGVHLGHWKAKNLSDLQEHEAKTLRCE